MIIDRIDERLEPLMVPMSHSTRLAIESAFADQKFESYADAAKWLFKMQVEWSPAGGLAAFRMFPFVIGAVDRAAGIVPADKPQPKQGKPKRPRATKTGSRSDQT